MPGTRDDNATEEQMLGLERAGRNTLVPLADHSDAATIGAKARGYTVRALALTATAADELAREIGVSQ